MTWPDRVSVYHKIRRAPEATDDSFILDAIILSERHQRPAARCVEDIVVYDYQKGSKTSLRPFMRDVMQETFRLQEKAKEDNVGQVLSLTQRVEKLEKLTWDRADAKEDFGSASR